MPGILYSGYLVGFIAMLILLSGCAVRQHVDPQQLEYSTPSDRFSPPSSFDPPSSSRARKKAVRQSPAKELPPVVKRTITEKEIRNIERQDSELHYVRCLEILARVNGKDPDYIKDDVKKKRPLSVPRDFPAYKNWSPLPKTLAGIDHLPKFILIVKDICFLGWYEHGRMVRDTYVCIGRMKTWTRRGMFKVKEKDPNHISTYPNAYGAPALMPFALHIYDRVWIHAGDVVGPNCSHGCINVPLYDAHSLYNWTDLKTPVLITESLNDLGKDMKANLPSPSKQQAQPQRAQPPQPAPRDASVKTLF